ncbi:unnamed protein product [Tetraodon nigroviridis]|uniref:(spotted green pufferfish) hypothetical protein n=1 Tax=Tetraodon nigroviridis TaxID=99883 RepID=Q4RW95_TETNG|nr:unnamed protein product [Tetraodon nigroviridis]
MFTVGIQMKLEFFQRKFWTASKQCAALDGKCSISCDDENINCYLIDNNGFILVAEDYTLSESTSPLVLTALKLANCVELFAAELRPFAQQRSPFGDYSKSSPRSQGIRRNLTVTLYDYQALCWVYSESSGSGHALLDPYFALLSAVKWILTELVIFLVEFNLCSWWYSDLTAKAQRMGRSMQVPCDTEFPAFISERTIKENTGHVDCDGCIKYEAPAQIPTHTSSLKCELDQPSSALGSFVIQQIPSSNLFMVVVDNKCDCSMFEPITMNPVEIIFT